MPFPPYLGPAIGSSSSASIGVSAGELDIEAVPFHPLLEITEWRFVSMVDERETVDFVRLLLVVLNISTEAVAEYRLEMLAPPKRFRDIVSRFNMEGRSR